MFLLPFVTVLREGLEGVVFIIGVGLGLPASSFPLAVVCGLGVGALIGYGLYR
jgi:high-affinity iron transporter